MVYIELGGEMVKLTENYFMRKGFKLGLKGCGGIVVNKSLKQPMKMEERLMLFFGMKKPEENFLNEFNQLKTNKGLRTIRSNKPIQNNYVYGIYKNGKIREERLSRCYDSIIEGFKCKFIYL